MKYPILNILVLFLAFSSFFHSSESVSTACVSSFSTPLRISLCNSNLGTVSFNVLSNGKLQINITLTGTTSRIQRIRIFIGTSNPSSDPGSSDYTTVQGSSFTSSQTVCGGTFKVAVAVVLVDADGATCTAWAVPDPTTGLPSAVTFTKFHPNGGFSGFFTFSFCDCPPTSCCNPVGFKFDCNSIQKCPLGNTFTDPNTGLGCYCGNVAGGGVACLGDRGTCIGATICASNSDCPTGSACQTGSCCNGASVCVPLCQTKFPSAPPCIQPPLVQPCCNATGFTFSCSNLKFCPQSNPVSGNQCYCGNVAGGGVGCLADRGTCDGAKVCTKNSDCPTGSLCQLSSCCSGQNICVQQCQTKFTSAGPCQQPTSPPSCCNSTNFVFKCPACTPAAGKTCPQTGDLSTCPRTNPKGNCYCANVAGGGVTCLMDRGTCAGATPCTTSVDCPSGSVCQKQSCCGGQDICVPLCTSTTECQNPQF